MSSVDLATRFKIGMYLFNRKTGCNAFPRLTDIIQVLNELPTVKIHIDGLLCPTHADKNTTGFRRFSL